LNGRCLSHSQITAKLVEGGMGQVYAAVDANLDRQVIIKILADSAHGTRRLREHFAAPL